MKTLAIAFAVAACLAWQPAAAQPAVTGVTAKAEPHHYVGPCPAGIEMVGTIYVSRPTKVSYRWERSDHGTGGVETIFIGNGSQVVTARWQAGRAGMTLEGWERLHVLSPGDHVSNPANFTLSCR